MATNTLWAQSEIIRTKAFPKWQTKSFNVATDMIKRSGEVEKVGERDFRIPVQLTVGGRPGTYDPQFGDMGRGSSGTGDVMIGTYFPMRLNFELDMLKFKVEQNGAKVTKYQPFKEAVASGFMEFQLYVDKWWHIQDGTAILATATAHTTSGGKSIYTLDTNFGANTVRRGQYISVYDTTLATQAATGIYIDKLDITARKATLSATVSGAAATDKFCLDGVTGASPGGLWGLPYWNSYATTGTTAGVNRANEPEIIANSVNASGYLAEEHVMALHDRVFHRRASVANELVAMCPLAQRAQVFSKALAVQQINVTSNSNDVTDRLPKLKGRKAFQFCGITHYLDIHQNATRIDYIVPSTWGRAQLAPMGFYELPGSRQRFFDLKGGSGAPAAGVWFGLTCDEQFYCTDSGANGVVYGLSLPTLYS